MRADRLLSLLMLLQVHGQLSAELLAKKLEVSVRTIYRDVEALSSSGIPVYSLRGPAGGICLVESYRTTLTNLTTEEARALFILSIPGPLNELGMGEALQAAWRKLAAALPDGLHRQDALAHQRVYLDWQPWSPRPETSPFLGVIKHATWTNHRLLLRYHSEINPWLAPLETILEPYGLVAKSGDWHIVGASKGTLRVIAISMILDAQVLNESFYLPDEFDLPAFWETWCASRAGEKPIFWATIRLEAKKLPLLRMGYGELFDQAISGEVLDQAERLILHLPFTSFEAARQRLLGMGGAVEVLAPEALRLSLIDFALQIVQRYQVHSQDRPA